MGAAGLAPTALAAALHLSGPDLAEVQDRAGFQRTLTQQIALGARKLPYLGAPAEAAEAAEVRAAMAQRIARADQALHDLAGRPSAPARATAGLRRVYGGPGGLEERTRAFLAAAQALADPFAPLPTAAEARALEARAEALMPALKAAVAAHIAAGRAVERVVAALLALAALLPVLVGLAGSRRWTRPLHDRLVGGAAAAEAAAATDPLTGALNRRAFVAALEGRLAAAGPGRHAGVLAVDLDWFKEINESEGHAGGDAALAEAARRLRAAVRAGDLVARIGGDEFAVAAEGLAGPDDLAELARRVRDTLGAAPVVHGGRALRLGASVGAVLVPPAAGDAAKGDAGTGDAGTGDAGTGEPAASGADWHAPEAALRLADEALAEAKRGGRGRWRVFGAAEERRARRAAAVLRSLDAADRDRVPLRGLRCHLQPVVGLRDGRVLGFEALARWNHPDLGPVPPGEFLDAAARGGRAAALGARLREEALAAFGTLRAAGGLPWGGGGPAEGPRVAVNVAPADLAADGFLRDFRATLARHGLAPRHLVVEITEDVLLDRVSDGARDRLQALRGEGARVVLDDFGTRHSGLRQLLAMPLDGLKLDGSFAGAVGGGDARAAGVVRATVSLARSLGLRVTAEGVETEAALRGLRALGCDAAQGFLLGRPASALHALEWCHGWPARWHALCGADADAPEGEAASGRVVALLPLRPAAVA